MQSERMKTELITNVSHDIKTPLTSIVNYAGLLQRDGLSSPDAPEYLEVLVRQSTRLKKLTEDLIEASKAATGNLTVELERTDLCELLRQAAGEYEERLGQNRLTPVVTAPETPVPVMADGQLLWRVIDNLLSNACKYNRPGGTIQLRATEEADRLVIEVADTGHGLSSEDIPQLFQPFHRVGRHTRHVEGTGLGLYIARQLMTRMGGDITAQGLPEVGACFTVHLLRHAPGAPGESPLSQGDAQQSVPSSAQATEGAPSPPFTRSSDSSLEQPESTTSMS